VLTSGVSLLGFSLEKIVAELKFGFDVDQTSLGETQAVPLHVCELEAGSPARAVGVSALLLLERRSALKFLAGAKTFELLWHRLHFLQQIMLD